MQVRAKAGETSLQDSASRLVDPETLRARVGWLLGGLEGWRKLWEVEVRCGAALALPNPLHSGSLPDQQV